MNGVQTRFKCKLDVKRCKRFVFPPSSLLPRSNALKTKAIRYFQTDRTLTRIVSPPLEYLIKPFSVKILRANIANLLANRELLRMRYANLDIEAKSMVPSANGTNSLDWKFISNVKKIVDENINNPEFSVNVLCESSGMSRTSFYCKLKALTGQSPTEFIRGMRLKRATELLKEGEYAINEISDMVGFSETKYFREVFKKYYKMSPSRYAKEGGNPSAELEDDEED